ncbi:hypothetical protein ACHMW6_06565 [Pseudoduganella sp. UC29_106]|uniref:hypothetical protein n=1 Tax=Pseudoduganella sp. UC29_106 TaxID=3374553 RepID=UPI003757FE46
MYAAATRLFEDQGRPVPRHRAITLQPTHAGNLTLTEEYIKEWRRTVRIAKLHPVNTQEQGLPSLYDAVVLWIGSGEMTIAGVEIDELTHKRTAQSWRVVIQAK